MSTSPLSKPRGKPKPLIPVRHVRSISNNTEETKYSPTEMSPIIVPSVIRTVSCSVIDLDEPAEECKSPDPAKPRRTCGDQQLVKTAIDFLKSIPGNQQNGPRKSITLDSSRTRKKCYKKQLHSTLACADYIDLAEFPSTINPGPLKEHFNQEFAEKYPELSETLTLSKIVNLREALVTRLYKLDVELCTFALGWTCFLRLIELRRVTKRNRKLLAAVCVLLAYKFTEETHLDGSKGQLQALLRVLSGLEASDNFQDQIIKSEFEVYSWLRFSLHLEVSKYIEHFNHGLKRISKSPKEYLGPYSRTQ